MSALDKLNDEEADGLSRWAAKEVPVGSTAAPSRRRLRLEERVSYAREAADIFEH
jgi:hypothetical protein